MFGERGKFAPPGIAGGLSGALNRFAYPDGTEEASPPMVSKMADIQLSRGQRVRLETPGGGGYGDPLTRDPRRVAEDVRLGYVSSAEAAEDYKCSVSEEGDLNITETQKLRVDR